MPAPTATPNATYVPIEHAPRRHQPAGRHANGPEPVLGVRAPARVGVVVREVRPDLDEDAAHERRREPQRLEDVLGARERRADQHGRDGGWQRAGPGRDQPEPQVAHGRRGNLPKSGLRFSR